MEEKLDKIVAESKGALDTDVGLMLYDNKIPVTYVILTFADRYEVYLYDDDRDVLVKGVGEDLETAKDLAVSNLQNVFNNYH